MAFFGVFGSTGEARARFDGRTSYLFAPVLHFSIDGRVALCHDGARTLDDIAMSPSHLFTATAAPSCVSLGRDRLTFLYRRHGRHLRAHIPCPASFAVYDAKRGRLILGGARGENCFIEETDGALFFSSDPKLLRSPIPIELAIIK